jgi:hypothetical protein
MAGRRGFSPSGFLAQQGLRRGLLGGNRAWLGTYLAYKGAVAVKRGLTRREQLLAIDKLKPGQRITIRTIPVKSGKERKELLRGQN